MTTVDELSHAQQVRMHYIDFQLATHGVVRRQSLVEHFGISSTTAASDFTRFRNMFRGAMKYDLHAKQYVAREGYETVLGQTGELRGAIGTLARHNHISGWR